VRTSTEPLTTYLNRVREMTRVPTQPRSPAEHYQAADRLVAAAPEEPDAALLAAVAHALLAAAPRRARKRPAPPARHTASSNWMFDEGGKS